MLTKTAILYLFILLKHISLSAQDSNTQSNYKVDSLNQIFKHTSSDSLKVILFNELALAHLNSNFDSAYFFANKGFQLAVSISNKPEIAKALGNIGIACYYRGDYDKAIDYYLQCLKVYEALNDKKGIAGILNQIGTFNKKQGHDQKALRIFKRALVLNSELNDKLGIASTMNNIGMVYENQGNLDEALEYYLSSLEMKENCNDKIGATYNMNNIAAVYTKQKKYDKALEYFLLALNVRQEMGEKQGVAITLNNIGELYLEQMLFQEASVYFQKSLDLSKEIGFLDLTKHTYLMLSHVYARNNDSSRSYQYYKKHVFLKDSLYNIERSRQISEMEIKYESAEKEKKIAVQDLELGRQKMQKSILAGSMFFLILMSFLLYNRYRLKQKNRLQTERIIQQKLRMKAVIDTQEKERKRIAEDLHDGIGQLLAGLKIKLSGLTSVFESSDCDKQESFNESSILLDTACDDLRNIAHQMMPKALSESSLESALDDLLHKTLKKSNIKFSLNTWDLNEKLNEDIVINLYRIVQELLSNTIKHAQASELNVQLYKNKNFLILILEDNGVGMISEDRKAKGMGMANIKSRVDSMNGNFSIDSGPNNLGTVANIRVPLN